MKTILGIVAFLMCLSGGSLYSQQFKLLQGKLAHENLSLSGIHVVNTSRANAVISNANGFFEISVQVGERLQFSGIQFKFKELIVSQSVFDSEIITVYLEAFVNELDEVVVKPHDLSGNLSSDIASANILRPLNFYDVGIPGFKGQREERIPSIQEMALSLALVQVDVEAVYKYVSGYYRKLKLKRKQDQEFKTMLKIIEFYGLYFFAENYNLEPEQVYDFILGCNENTTLILLFNQNRHQEVVQTFSDYIKNYTQNDVPD